MGEQLKNTDRYRLFGGTDRECQTHVLIDDRIQAVIDSDYPITPATTVDYSNAIKYLMRWMNKGGISDLKKCRVYLDRLIASLDETHTHDEEESALLIKLSEVVPVDYISNLQLHVDPTDDYNQIIMSDNSDIKVSYNINPHMKK